MTWRGWYFHICRAAATEARMWKNYKFQEIIAILTQLDTLIHLLSAKRLMLHYYKRSVRVPFSIWSVANEKRKSIKETSLDEIKQMASEWINLFEMVKSGQVDRQMFEMRFRQMLRQCDDVTLPPYALYFYVNCCLCTVLVTNWAALRRPHIHQTWKQLKSTAAQRKQFCCSATAAVEKKMCQWCRCLLLFCEWHRSGIIAVLFEYFNIWLR